MRFGTFYIASFALITNQSNNMANAAQSQIYLSNYSEVTSNNQHWHSDSYFNTMGGMIKNLAEQVLSQNGNHSGHTGARKGEHAGTKDSDTSAAEPIINNNSRVKYPRQGKSDR